MGKIGRIACIATPMVLTFISIVLLLVVILAGWNKSDANLSSLYYFKANTTAFKTNLTISNLLTEVSSLDSSTQTLVQGLVNANTGSNISDIYQIYLWNYCSGDISNSTGNVELTYCSPHVARYWFNPVEVWGLNSSGVASLFPSEIKKGLSIYKGVSQWMFVAYAIALGATVVNILVGLLAICSRWGSCVTTIVSCTATLFSFLAALTSTILFSVLTGLFNSALKGYGIHLSVGTKMFALDWLAFAFSLASTLFWTVSICCCSGKSSHSRQHKKHDSVEHGYGGSAPAFGSKGYAPLGEEHGQHRHSNVEMSGYGSSSPYTGRDTAYEPYRHS